MTRLVLAALAIALGSASAPAAQFLTIDGFSGAFGDTDIICPAGDAPPCPFDNIFTFDAPAGFGSVSLTITSIAASDDPAELSNLDFTSVQFNGFEFANKVNGVVEFRSRENLLLLPTGNRITVSGSTYGNAAFAGTLAFVEAAPAPEPSTWVMMIIGFGAVGASLRSARRHGPSLAVQ